MTSGTFVDGRVNLVRTEAERAPLVRRLGRIEGQVRGLRAMIEVDRYCLDDIQQIRAATAALREVELLILGQHLAAGLTLAMQPQDREAVLEDLQRVLRAAMAETR
ncbi:metal-sensitive transcriptional regulator [Methylobacterium sp. E-005]|uniref:metal-sensitive transcriptional regulator n=1 Tax=Methylobacterium sp. E-005 TaxID=2836549 RepID=UPI001FB8B0B0|nr:metal-sensitive transcriptional regulator [Methylobacterium sp. E-005]MCJ2090011.1 metal-sensitive transcriptional regulator [Methylobacterium sp. E-005]